jgi:uncharacterized protein YjiS (DUF1127 family)
MPRHATVARRTLLLSMIAQRALDDARRLKCGAAALTLTLAEWEHRERSRAELNRIPDHQLKDLPYDTSVILNERQKPFWRA